MTTQIPGINESASSDLLSIVVPVFNEAEMLPLFLERITPIITQLNLRAELVFVDDGSDDGSIQYLMRESSKRPALRVVQLSRNFGKEAALTAGLEFANGDAIIIIDADLQDPPEKITEMVACWQSGVDVVLMKRRSRSRDSRLKQISAYGFYRILNRTSKTQIPVDVGDFRLMSKQAVSAVLQLRERNRYMKGLFAWIGMPTEILLYDREARPAGKTKWEISGLFGLAIEGLTSFSISPLRWATALGLFTAGFGALFGIWIVLKTVILSNAVNGYPSLVSLITFFGGVQLLSVGIVGEYVGKTYLETKQRPLYIAKELPPPNRTSFKFNKPQREGMNHA